MKALYFTVLLAAAAAIQAAGPDPAELLTKARKALGGEAKFAELKTLVATGSFRRNMSDAGTKNSDANVMTGDLEISIMLPDKFLKEETLSLPNGMAGPTLVEALSGDRTWNDTRSAGPGMIVRMMKDGDETGHLQDLKSVYARYLLSWTLNTPQALSVQFTYAGEAEAPDGRADVLDGKGADGFAIRMFLDKDSHMPLMLSYRSAARMTMIRRSMGEAHGDPRELEKQIETMPKPKPRQVDYQLHLSDYRKVNGIQLPFQLSWTSEGAVTEEFEVKKYIVNATLKPEKFEKK